MNKKSPQGMRDLARATGFSVATISRALRGHRSVLPETRERVLAAVKELGYEFNPYVGQLMSSLRGRSGSQFKGNLALLWYDTTPADKHSRLLEIRESAFSRAAELGYSMDEFYRCNYTPDRLNKVMLNRSIGGVLISPAFLSHGKVHMRLKLDSFAVASLGWSLYHPAFNSIRFDHFQSIRLAVHYARRKFGSDFGALFDLRYDRRADGAFRAGFLTHHPAGPTMAQRHIFDLNKLNLRKLHEAFDKGRLRSLIAPARDQIPPEVLASLPSESFIYLGDLSHRNTYGVIDYQYGLLGRWGVDLLVATIQKYERGVPDVPMIIYVPPRWVDGSVTPGLSM